EVLWIVVPGTAAKNAGSGVDQGLGTTTAASLGTSGQNCYPLAVQIYSDSLATRVLRTLDPELSTTITVTPIGKDVMRKRSRI
ncbi:MAG: hypothetical protein ACKVP3_10030, partial [Hyphomicrobiaceae bacterium]